MKNLNDIKKKKVINLKFHIIFMEYIYNYVYVYANNIFSRI